MKAITLIPGTNQVQCVDVPEPALSLPDDVKLKVLEVGICGTDRDIASGGRASAPPGEKGLIIGHEMLGEVIAVGKSVKEFKVGDLAVVTVRRGCGQCVECHHDRADLCTTGNYTERGIKGRHGFQAEYVVDQEKFLVKVPSDLRAYGVLCEPMSVVEKAVDEGILLQQAHLTSWNSPEEISQKQALVVGLGPIGLLACIALRLRGLKVFGIDLMPPESDKAILVQEMGGTFIDGRGLSYKDIPAKYGAIDLIYEAVGNANVDFQILDALGYNACAVFTGVPEPHGAINIEGARLMHDAVMKNQILCGSVNATKKHWELAIADLQKAKEKWEKTLAKLITSRCTYDRFKEVLFSVSQKEIKIVLTWN